jgi:hypothetical protein
VHYKLLGVLGWSLCIGITCYTGPIIASLEIELVQVA